MNTLKKYLLLFILVIISSSVFAQNVQAPVEMAEGLYQSGKIYVVVCVIAIIFIGIVTYLVMLDRKICRLEKEIKNK
jgi:CcmD family protein